MATAQADLTNISSALELGGSKVCVQSGTTTELNLQDYFRANNMSYEAVATASAEESLKAYSDGRCDVVTADASQLHGERLKLWSPRQHDILPEIISKEPLGPVVRQDDFQWFNVVKWTYYALINAEGDAEYNAPFTVGAHSVAATYAGDKSYNSSTASPIATTTRITSAT